MIPIIRQHLLRIYCCRSVYLDWESVWIFSLKLYTDHILDLPLTASFSFALLPVNNFRFVGHLSQLHYTGTVGRAFLLRFHKFYLSVLFSKYEIVFKCKYIIPKIYFSLIFFPREISNPMSQKVLKLEMLFLKDSICD